MESSFYSERYLNLGVWNTKTKSLSLLKECTPEEKFYMLG